MNLGSLQIRSKILILATVILALIFIGSIFIHPHVMSQTIDRTTHDMVVEGLQDQVELLKWVGTGVIGSLCAVIVILWRTSQRQQRVIVEEVRSQAVVRQEILVSSADTRGVMERLTDAVLALEKKISECPVAKEWEQFKTDIARAHKR